MNHLKAVSIIEELSTQINDGNPPKDVLLKYAKENDLPPSQLERLGQVFNTAKTISYLSKSASRGGNHSLININDLVDDYTDFKATPNVIKKASNITSSTNAFKIPNLWSDPSEVVKSASEPTKDLSLYSGFNKASAQKKLQDAAQFIADLEDHKDYLKNKMHQSIYKMAHVIYEQGNKEVFSNLDRDSYASFNKNSNALANISYVLKKTYNTEVAYFPMEKKASIKFVRDTTGLLASVSSLEDEIADFEACEELLKEATAREGRGSDPRVQNLLDVLSGKAQPGPSDSGDDDGQEDSSDTASATDEGPQGAAPAPVSSQATPTAPAQGNALDGLRNKDTSKDMLLENFNRLLNPKGPDVIGKPSIPGKGIPQLPGKGILNFVTDKLKGNLVSPAKVNSQQMKIDDTRNDTSRMAMLHKAIMKDPILQESGAARVLDLYNSLYSQNPEMMSDPNLMSYALREAIQYDGVAPHTVTELATTRKNSLDAEQKARALKQDDYKTR